jgi:dienelactone hydrolase
MFAYQHEAPFGLVEIDAQRHGSSIIREVRFAHPTIGEAIAAHIVQPDGPGPFAAILYSHWFDAEPTDREEFVDEAIAMAHRGVVSLLPTTMWSEPTWFDQRERADDFAASMRQVIALQRAVEVLLAQPGVDATRLGYVGHDFGAMYGALVAALVNPLRAFVFMAGTERFSDWFLYGPQMTEPDRTAFVAQFAPLDPVNQLPRSQAAATLFQFAETDVHVPKERALRLFAAAPEPKQVAWYQADHSLNLDQARRDRDVWLAEQLAL